MAKRRRKKYSGTPILGSVIIILSILYGISVYTYSPESDSGIWRSIWARLTDGNFRELLRIKVANAGGVVGAFCASFTMFVFGKLGWLCPIMIFLSGFSALTGRGKWHFSKNVKLGLIILMLTSALFTVPIAGLDAGDRDGHGPGGAIGYLIAKTIKVMAGTTGAYILTILAIICAMGLISPRAVRKIFNGLLSLIGRMVGAGLDYIKKSPGIFKSKGLSKRVAGKSKIKIIKPETAAPTDDQIQNERQPVKVNIKREEIRVQEPVEEKTPIRSSLEGEYSFPELSLFDKVEPGGDSESDADIKERAEILKRTLNTFGVKINEDSVESYPGPVITRFEFQPAPGIKVSQFVTLADDLALAMKAKSIRVIAPIPGKGAVGIEIPNKKPHIVPISDLMSSPEFRSNKYMIPLALGKDTGGHPFIADLARMPHLLIAGATGSGKSVCLNGIITSILYRLHPNQARFIFIDPKMLELSVYSGIPHLERPVVTRPRQAERVLMDAVEEMENRYSILAESGVRNIQNYNQKIASQEQLPYVIIIVDELADLLVGSSNKIELMITRLAQMARAVGIHLILATQRPSVDVITGLIKANFSSRIAFQVASKVDSRTILDANGAEKLLGSGDMLVMLTGQQELIRVHGSYVSSGKPPELSNF